ncbi:hypothetical protein [Povalibacter sp.]|uniref:hypothetical protein n=1 Tax=Povalibacter sp. TaxID=1962978 RepID=UPI002F3E41A2
MKDELKKLGLRIRPRKVGGETAPAQPGKIAFDDLGNAKYEWQGDQLNEDSETGERARRKALAHVGLSLVEDEPPTNAPIRQNPKGLRVGYNPYESGLLTKKERKPKRDLHALSRWIEARKKLNGNPPEDK